MKLLEVILISISGAFLVIGTHQLFVAGFGFAYPFYMTMIACFMAYGYVKIKNNEKEQQSKNIKPISKSKK